MKINFLIIVFVFANFIFGQCDDNINQAECINDNSCVWFEDITYFNCSNFGNSSSCDIYADYGCSWEFSWGGWQNYGSSCVGGSFQIDNGYCEEIAMPECSDMHEHQCVDDSSCDWIEDIEIIYCDTLPTSGWGPGVCEYYYPDCYNYLDYGGSYGSWSTECGGDTAQIDNSFCQEIEIIQQVGDINNDSIINILDVIETVNIILNNEYNEFVDMNHDMIINVLDILQIINLILGSD